MAIVTVPQTVQSRKGSSGKNQYLEGFSRADYDLNRYDVSGQMRTVLEKAILSGTNEQAFTILSAVDAIDHIPGAGKNFIPLNGFASFYGVSEEYLKGVLNRRRFLHKNYPEDVKRVYGADLLHVQGVPLVADTFWKVPGRDDLIRYRLSDYYGPPCVSLPKSCSFFVYSPRIVLATALSLLYTDKSGENNMAKKIALAIKRSDYRVIAEDEPEDSAENIDIPASAIPMGKDGEIKLSLELINYIIRTAAEVILEQQAKAAEKQEKPDDWDDILARWKYGKLTTHKAAKMAGMSVAAFCDYASGKKTFD